MKKIIVLLLLFLICFVYPIYADDEVPEETEIRVSNEAIRLMTANMDNLFPISSLVEKFTTPEKPVFYEHSKDAFTRTYTESGKKNMVTVVNPDGVHDIIGSAWITEGYPTNFQMSMDVHVDDVYPSEQAGCSIGFTNKDLVSAYAERPEEMILLYINGSVARVYNKEEAADAGTQIDLGVSAGSKAKLTIIHLTGFTFFYINGVYAGQYHDGLSGPFMLIYGPIVFSSGEIANCTYDNLQIRKVEQ